MYLFESTHQWQTVLRSSFSDFIRLLSHFEITKSPLRTLTSPQCVIEWNYQWTCCTHKWPDSNFLTPLMTITTSKVLLRKLWGGRLHRQFFFIFCNGFKSILLCLLIYMNMENGTPANLMRSHWVWLNDSGLQSFCSSKLCIKSVYCYSTPQLRVWLPLLLAIKKQNVNQ